MRYKKKDKSQWHPWFAWYPVKVDGYGDIAWWEWVEAKYLTPHYSLLGYFFSGGWIYSLPLLVEDKK